jgi:hypothetical protein
MVQKTRHSTWRLLSWCYYSSLVFLLLLRFIFEMIESKLIGPVGTTVKTCRFLNKTHLQILPNIAIELLVLLLRIINVPGSILGPDAGYTDLALSCLS